LRVIVAPLLQQAFHFGVMSCRDEKSRLAQQPHVFAARPDQVGAAPLGKQNRCWELVFRDHERAGFH
jgi:hypothetical protein